MNLIVRLGRGEVDSAYEGVLPTRASPALYLAASSLNPSSRCLYLSSLHRGMNPPPTPRRALSLGTDGGSPTSPCKHLRYPCLGETLTHPERNPIPCTYVAMPFLYTIIPLPRPFPATRSPLGSPFPLGLAQLQPPARARLISQAFAIHSISWPMISSLPHAIIPISRA